MLSSDDDFEFESLEHLRMDLEELKARGNQLRLEYRRELQSLKQEFAPLLDTLHSTHEHQGENIMYQHAMGPKSSFRQPQQQQQEVKDEEEKKEDGGFIEISQEEAECSEQEYDDEPEFTPFVRKIQSQLCAALHQQEVNQRQIKFAQRGNKRLIVFLSTEIEAQKHASKKREEELEIELKRVEGANSIMMDMLERDALDQEEAITELRLQLGMDPTPNSQRKNFRQRHRRRMQRISGGLRSLRSNIGRRVRETPRNIRDSKVWKDLVAPEEDQPIGDLDVSERRRGIMQRLRRSVRAEDGESSSPDNSPDLPPKKTRFHSSRVEKLTLEDIEQEGRLGIVGRIRRSRQMRRESSEAQQYLDNRASRDSFDKLGERRPLQGVRRRASNLRKRIVGRNHSGNSLESIGSTQPPTPPTSDKALFPMDDASFDAEVLTLSI